MFLVSLPGRPLVGVLRQWTAGERRSQSGTDAAIQAVDPADEEMLEKLLHKVGGDGDTQHTWSAVRSWDDKVRGEAKAAIMAEAARKRSGEDQRAAQKRRRKRRSLTQRFDGRLREGLVDVAVAFSRLRPDLKSQLPAFMPSDLLSQCMYVSVCSSLFASCSHL